MELGIGALLVFGWLFWSMARKIERLEQEVASINAELEKRFPSRALDDYDC